MIGFFMTRNAFEVDGQDDPHHHCASMQPRRNGGWPGEFPQFGTSSSQGTFVVHAVMTG
jgi:hypothetical protein